MGLTAKALEILKKDGVLRAKLVLTHEDDIKKITDDTVLRWVRNNDDNLTKSKYTSVMSIHTGLTLDEILESENAKA